jgi:hypothetical protein
MTPSRTLDSGDFVVFTKVVVKLYESQSRYKKTAMIAI